MFIFLNFYTQLLNSKLLIIIGVIIAIGLGTVAVFSNVDSTDSQEENILDQSEESKPRLVQRGLTESLGINEP